jgi:hypothetical protein
MEKTVPKNRTIPVLAKIASVKAYALDNGFSGKPIENLSYFLNEYLPRFTSLYKVKYDPETKRGTIKFHSNEWYYFQTT